MHSELDVNFNNFKRSFPNFGKPKIIGFIGINNLRYCKKVKDQKVNYNLNHLVEEAKHRPKNLDVKLTDLLFFLNEHRNRLCLPLVKDLSEARFYCYRGLMTCIACTPYENREPWKIVVILYKGNIYMCSRDTEDKINRINNMSEREQRCTSWGYKFEQYVLSVGVDTILCGFRNDDGIVEEIRVIPVRELPKISQRFWDPNVCFNFLDTFLTYVKRCIAKEIRMKYGQKALSDIQNLPLISLLFEWQPRMPVKVVPNYKHEDDPILPDWFINNFSKST